MDVTFKGTPKRWVDLVYHVSPVKSYGVVSAHVQIWSEPRFTWVSWSCASPAGARTLPLGAPPHPPCHETRHPPCPQHPYGVPHQDLWLRRFYQLSHEDFCVRQSFSKGFP